MDVPRQSLLIASTPRSGSWLLAEGLRSLGIAGQPEEYFAVDAEPAYRQRWGMPPTGTFSSFLERVVRGGTTANGVFATKLHWFQLQVLLHRLRQETVCERGVSTELELLRAHFGRTHIVYLLRENVLLQAVSWHRAIASNRWWRLSDGAADQGTDPAGYDFEAIKSLLWLLRDYNSAWSQWFRDNDIRPLMLTYEDLVSDYHGSLAAVVSLLGGVPPARVPPTTLARQSDARSARWASTFPTSWRSVFGSQPPSLTSFEHPDASGHLSAV